MKKVIIMALVILAGAINVDAAKKDKKAKKMVEVFEMDEKAPVVLNNAQDSVSYALGMSTTRGLMDYLQQQVGLDTMYMADFKKGFEEALQRGTDPKYVAYNAGVQIAQQAKNQILQRASSAFEDTPLAVNENLFFEGFIAGAMSDQSLFTPETADQYQRERAEEMKEIQKQKAITENTAWLEENAKKEGMVTSASGLQYRIADPGNDIKPTFKDTVWVHYKGTLIDGTVFDECAPDQDPIHFTLDRVIRGWSEGMTYIGEGGKIELYVPAELGYGEQGTRGIEPNSVLIFNVELTKVGKFVVEAAE